MTRLVLLVCVCLVPAVSVATPPSGDAAAVIRAYNARDIGAPGWRRAVLELRTAGVVTRRLVVSNVWSSTPEGLRTLFVLEDPPGLRGICYLMTETPTAERFMKVHLFMPVGAKRLLEVAASLEEQGLLGSDFSYRDLSWQLPEGGYERRIVGEGTLMDRAVTFVEYTAKNAGDIWPRRRYAISRAPFLMMGIDFFRHGSSVPDKTYRVERFEQRGKVWTPTRITVTRGDSVSVLTLEDAGFALTSMPEELLNPQALASTAMRARAGSGVEQLLKDR